MANNYLEFSEVLPNLTSEEEAWLKEQLEPVHVFGDKHYTEETLPEGLDASDARHLRQTSGAASLSSTCLRLTSAFIESPE